MSDVVEYAEGNTTYRIVGLRARGEAITAKAGQIRDQLAIRAAAADKAIADFKGTVAVTFRDQVVYTFGALTTFVADLGNAASVCANFPAGPSRPEAPDPPTVRGVADRQSSGANTQLLREFAQGSADWDAQVRSAGAAVSLDGVSATKIVRRSVPVPPGVIRLQIEEGVPPNEIDRTPTIVEDGPFPVDPATLVQLPTVGGSSARATGMSTGAAELAALAASAFDRADSGLFGWLAEVLLNAKVLELQRHQGLPPRTYRDQLQQFWLDQAYAAAGIDPTTWDPTLGAEANRHNIELVYTYYGNLFLQHPELQWAGMANMIGPSFAAGFFDLASMRGFAGSMGDALDRLPGPVRAALPAHIQALADLGELTAEDLRFYETTFLTMQKQIFIDQAVMHEAYLTGGMPALQELLDAGIIDTRTRDAWGDIASGDPSRVSSGNRDLLLREQMQIIPDFYDEMYNHFPTGPAMTYAMTMIGEPSIPGARGYPEVFPLTLELEAPSVHVGTPDHIPGTGIGLPNVEFDTPTVSVELETPLADGNIANRDDRWALIEQDTLPAYQALLADDPEQVRQIVSTPVDERIADYRLPQRLDDIVGLLDNWDINIDFG